MKKNLLLLLVVGSVGQIVASDALLIPAASVPLDENDALVELAHPASPEPSFDTTVDQLNSLQLTFSSAPAVGADSAAK